MMMVKAVLAIVMSAVLATAASAQDIDRDGLPDAWERNGGGGTRLGHLAFDREAVRVGRRDVFVLIARRDTKNFGDARADLDRVKRFYADIPIVNQDGSTGINIIFIERDPLPESIRDRVYFDAAVRDWILPPQWRGYGHGYLLEDGPGGGGNTGLCLDMSGSGYDWRTVAHELGHQFHLDHTLPRQSDSSPLYASIMNPLFNYELGGDPAAVRFSLGMARDLTIDERAVSEVLNYPIQSLRYLSAAPLSFRLEQRDRSTTCVDWNRNGVLCEGAVRADVNDATDTFIGATVALGPTSGSPALGAVGTSVYIVFPMADGDPSAWSQAFEQPARGASLVLREMRNGRLQASTTPLARSGVFSDPSAAGFGHRLAVAYVGANGIPIVEMWKTDALGGVRGPKGALILPQFRALGASIDHVRLVAQPRDAADGEERLWLFAWSKTNSVTHVIEIIDEAGALQNATRTSLPRPRVRGGANRLVVRGFGDALSRAPIGVAHDRARRRLVAVTTQNATAAPGALVFNDLIFAGDRWYVEEQRTVGGVFDPQWASDRAPTLLMEEAPGGGGSLATIIAPGRGAGGQNIFAYKQYLDRTTREGWRRTKMGNLWNATVSSAAVLGFGDDHVYALRWFAPGEANNNQVLLAMHADGKSSVFSDRDDREALAWGVENCPSVRERPRP